MSAQATQNDDLIILSDNIPSSFDASNPIVSPQVTQNTEESNPIISFDANQTETNQSSTDNIVIGEQTPESNPVISLSEDNNLIWSSESPVIWLEETATTPNIDLNLGTEASPSNDLFNLNELKEETPTLEKTEETVNNSLTDSWDLFLNSETQAKDEKEETATHSENAFDFWWISISWDLNKESQEEDVLSWAWAGLGIWLWLWESKDDSLDMDSILDNTIEKLKKRQDWISWQKTSKQQVIDELEEKIKELREEVSTLKKEISDLDEENWKIELNVGHLEAMKAGKTPQITPKTRTHNSKKVLKVTK